MENASHWKSASSVDLKMELSPQLPGTMMMTAASTMNVSMAISSARTSVMNVSVLKDSTKLRAVLNAALVKKTLSKPAPNVLCQNTSLSILIPAVNAQVVLLSNITSAMEPVQAMSMVVSR